MESKEFEFEEKTYEIRITCQNDSTRVKVFLNDKPANGYEYSVNIEVAFSFKNEYGYHPVLELIKTAESDVKNKFWEKYLEATKNNK